MTAFSAIIKGTYACPLNCVYCYNGPQHDRREVISVECAVRITEQVCALAERRGFSSVEFIWMGGEPLLVPKNVFDAVVDRQRRFVTTLTINNFLQTSGYLVERCWPLLHHLAMNGFQFSVSIDGPADIHDAQRVRRGGGPTHEIALQCLDRLRDIGAMVGAIAVLTREACSNIDKFYSFFAERDIPFSFLPPYHSGSAYERLDLIPTSEELSAALIRAI